MREEPNSRNYNDKSETAYYWLLDNGGRVLLVALFLWLGIWGLALEGREDLGRSRLIIRGMGPELAGIVIGAVAIDFFNERRQTQQLKNQLIRQMGVNSRDVAVSAARELAHHGWLYDGSMSGAYLSGAILSNANLDYAILPRAYLYHADLSETRLIGANLNYADISSARMEGASLYGANLREANLRSAKLTKADLQYANLKKANFGDADLQETNLSRADLSNADIFNANLYKSALHLADLSGAMMLDAKLSEAGLYKTNLSQAYMWEANLKGVGYWTIEQLEQAKNLGGAIMPDGIQLGGVDNDGTKLIEGPTFREWKANYLQLHGGQDSDIRDVKDKWFLEFYDRTNRSIIKE